jgi:hypothetical protein
MNTFLDAVMAGRCAGNQSMMEHCREAWQEEDIEAARRAFGELWDVKLNQPRFPTVPETSRIVDAWECLVAS